MISRINAGLQCPYCMGDSEVIDSAEIYGRSYGILYICRKCEAWTGAHKETGESLGRLANAELREWKIKAHNVFDRLWKPPPGRKRHMTRKQAYYWLATTLQIDPATAHIGMLDVAQCRKLITACNKQFPPDQIVIEF